MRHKFNWVLALLFIAFLPSCTDKNTPEQPDEQQAKYYVIYDTDIGSSTDDLFALKILYNASKRGQCELIGGVVCRMGDSKAALADLMNTHYFADAHLPLGIERNGVEEPNEYISYEGIADLQKEDQTTMFPCSTSDYSTLPDGWKLYRKLLADKPDRSVKICAIGMFAFPVLSIVPVFAQRVSMQYFVVNIILYATLQYTLKPKWVGALFVIAVSFVLLNYSLPEIGTHIFWGGGDVN